MKAASTNGAMIVGGDVSASNNIELQSKESLQTNGKLTAIQGEIALTSDAGNVAVKEEAKAKTDVTLSAKAGSVAVDGAVTSTEGDVKATAKEAVTITADVTAKQNVALTSENADIKQSATAGIQAQTVTAVSAKGVELQGKGNQFATITVQSFDANAGIQGSVLVQDSADNLNLSIESAVNGNITVENKKSQGTLHAITELQANGDGADAKGDITLQSDGSLQTDSRLTATNDVKAASTNGAMTVSDDVSASNNIELQSKETLQTNGKLTAIQGEIALTSDAGNVAAKEETTAKADVILNAKEGSVAIDGTVTSTVGNVKATAKEAVTIAADVTAKQNVALTSENADITQSATAGIQANTVTAVSAKDVNLQGAKNAFDALTVQSSDANAPLQGSVSVLDKADKLELSVQPIVNGDIAAENTKANGVLHVVSEELRANGDETGGVKGSISLKSDGSLQTDAKLTAADDVNLTSVSGDVSINGDISTGDKALDDLRNFDPSGQNFNSLTIKAGGAVNEAACVKIETPVVATYTGKGVSLESEKNAFSIFVADASGDGGVIGGSVKATTNYHDDNRAVFIAGVKAPIQGDIELSNVARQGGLDILSMDEGAIIDVRGGNGAQGNMVLTADGNLGLLGNTKAAHDIVIESANGSFSGIGRSMEAGYDVLVSAGDAVTYIGTISAGNDMDIRVTSPSSDGRGIRIGELSENETLLEAGNEARFYVKGDGDIHFAGDVIAEKGDVVANIDNEGRVLITGSVESKNGDVSVQTGKGEIYIGVENTPNEETIKANNNVTVGTDLGTIYIQGKTSTITGDITMTAGKDSYDQGTDTGNFIIRDDGKLNSGGGVVLNGRNGDIEITDDIQAAKGITVNIAEQGNASFGRDVSVTNDVNISTDRGTITVGHTVNSDEGNVSLQTGNGDVLVGKDITAGKDVSITSQQGSVVVGDVTTGTEGDILAEDGDVSIQAGQDVVIVKTITAQGQEGDIDIASGQGDIIVGNTVSSDEGNVSLKSENGDVLVGQDVTAGQGVSITSQQGSVVVGDVTTGTEGDILAEDGDASIQAGQGYVKIVKTVTAQQGSIDVQVGTGGVTIGNNGPGVETVTAYKNIDIGVEQGQIEIYGKTSTKTGNISLSAAESQYIPGGQNIIIAQNGELDSAQDARLTGRNGDLRVTDAVKATRNLEVTVLDEGDITLERDVNVVGNTAITNTGRGNINGHDIVSGGTTHVALTNGDLFLNLAEGKAVVLRMENNTAASRVNTVKAEASGGAGLDVELTGNFIQIGTVEAKGGNSVLQLSAIGAGNQKLISGEISVGSLRSGNGTHMPSLWANRGNVHVDEGNLAIDDVLAKDKIHLENNLTDLAIFGRTPTWDGEQLVYWNNLGRAYSKQRYFQLYTDGKVRTRGAVLIDAGRHYGKLYGDNLSVVDMMRERLTNEHGQYTFDRTWFTKPSEALREKVLFGMEAVDADIRKHNASDGELL